MITTIYSVYDSKAAAHNVPFFFARDQMAVRAFTDLCNDPQSRIAAHPSDYSLVKVGTFNDDTGLITSMKPITLGIGSSFVKMKDPVTRS